MHLAACIDLGLPLDWLNQELAKLTLASEYRIVTEPAAKMGINGTRVRVETKDQHDHRHHSTIAKLITEAGLSPGVEQRALRMFQTIAEAEAKIHAIDIEQVHFHEVGAIDAIVDIVAAALAIEYFQVQHVLCAPIEVGSGTVECAHGTFPVPAPATQEILAGAPLRYGGVIGESTTPTGAAIVAGNTTEFSPTGNFAASKIGYGIGHKDFAQPNVLRIALGDYQPAQANQTSQQTHIKIEANIDDMSPEAFEPLADALFKAGAVDVYYVPIVMKKGRPAQMVCALCSEDISRQVADTLLNFSTTIGLRKVPFDKVVLPREHLELTTSFGSVSVKRVTQPNGQQRWKLEHDDVRRLAKEHDEDYQSLRTKLEHEIRTQIG